MIETALSRWRDASPIAGIKVRDLTPTFALEISGLDPQIRRERSLDDGC
jgi:hypothetical protein